MIEVKFTPKQLALITGLSEFELQDRLEGAEDAGQIIFEAARERSKKVGGEKVAEGYSKLGKRANQLLRPLAEKYGFDLGDTIEESFGALESALSTVETPTDGMTKEGLLKNQIVQQIVAERAQALTAKFEEQKKAFEAQISETKRAATKSTAVREIANILQSQNAVLGQATPDKAAEIALQLIGLDTLNIDATGNLVVMRDGATATDEFGNALSLTDVVKSSWALGFQQVDPSKGGGSPPLPGNNPMPQPQGARFGSIDEAQKALSNPKITPAERAVIFTEIAKMAVKQ